MQFLKPLRFEYAQIHKAINNLNLKKGDTLTFIRPAENAFHRSFNVLVYNDEFGLPSTYKDWTPDPLIRQIRADKFDTMQDFDSLVIVQFASGQAIGSVDLNNNVVIDMDSLLKRR